MKTGPALATRCGVFVSACLLGSFGPSVLLLAATPDPVQRRSPEDSAEQNVRRALGHLTYAIRSEDPSLVAAEFASLLAPGAPAISTADAASFFDLYHAQARSPLVYFANPQIIIDGSSAVVTCLAHWQFVNESGVVMRLKESERLVFKLDGSRYVLMQARSAPLVLKSGGDAAAYARSLIEVDRAIAENETREGF